MRYLLKQHASRTSPLTPRQPIRRREVDSLRAVGPHVETGVVRLPKKNKKKTHTYTWRLKSEVLAPLLETTIVN